MNKKVVIVEDEFVEANDLRLILRKAGYQVCDIARSVEIARDIIIKEKPGLVLLDIFLKGDLTGIDLARELKEENIAFIYLSANSNEDILSAAKTTDPYGFIVKPFREKDLLVMLEFARYRHEHSRESRYRREAAMAQQLEEALVSNIDWREKLREAAKVIQQEIPFDYLAVNFDNSARIEDSTRSFLRIGFNEYQTIGVNELSMICGTTTTDLAGMLSASGKETRPAFFNNEEFDKLTQKSPLKKVIKEAFQMKALLSFPLLPEEGEIINLFFYSRRPDIYNSDHISLLYRLQQTLVKICKQNPEVEKTSKRNKPFSLKSGETVAKGFEGIIGNSHLLLNVFDLITQVAPFDTSVLILGESGTGKEKIAECIHKLSPRKLKPLVKINCAALPPTLIESELFGHEKGSFTGASNKRAGKFEQANGGTIFLDEIGEIPLDLQVKLLRVLQEKEVEPIGSRAPAKTDVRIIAATNKNLEREVGEGRFRLDLYYRLNVFPIILPPLRERLEDVPALAQHFIEIYNRKSGKKVTGVSDKVLKIMLAYDWPGNIRELENLIERGVLLSKGTEIEEILLTTVSTTGFYRNNRDADIKSIHENERDYIVSVLKKCNGKIWGADGAAKILKIPPTTLRSKMIKLGIERENIQ